MKTFIVTLVLILGGLSLWALWPRNDTTDLSFADETPTPTAYDIGYFTPTPVVSVVETVSPTPTPTPKRTATPTPLGQGGIGPKPIRVPLFANMLAVNNSGEYGVVALTANNNDLAVISFNMAGNPTGLYQQAYIVRGTCASMGSTQYSLNPLINGASSTTLNADFLEVAQSQTSLAVVVSSPDGQIQIPYSCGQLR